MVAETVAEEMSENVSEEEAETEKITVKLVETEELVKRKGSPLLILHCQASQICQFHQINKM